MARPLTVAQLAALQHRDAKVFYRLEVRDADNAWRDLTAQNGVDWVHGLSMTPRTLDQPVAQVTFRVGREARGGLSLATLHESSPLNQDAGSSYAPLIELNREWRASAAVMEPGQTPSSGDWVPFFEGYGRTTQQANDPMSVTVYDRGVRLVNAWVQEATVYGSETTTIEALMAEILADWSGDSLYVPESVESVLGDPVVVPEYTQQPMRVMDALQQLAIKIGFTLRYEYDAAGVSRLTLADPKRSNTTASWTYGPDDYTDVTDLSLDFTPIRNDGEVRFQDRATGAQLTAYARDTASIAQYQNADGFGGRMWFRIQEGSDSPIDSLPEAQVMVDSAVSDMAFPPVNERIRVPFNWSHQLNDVVDMLANGVHYTTDQKRAIVAIQHELEDTGEAWTMLSLRAKPAGAYLGWFAQRQTSEDREAQLLNFRDEVLPDGKKRFRWNRNGYVSEVWVHDRLVTVPEGQDDWPDETAPPDTVLAAANSYDAEAVADGENRLLQFTPRDASLVAGPLRRVRMLPGGITFQVPVLEVQPSQAGTVATLAVTIDDPDSKVTEVWFKAKTAPGDVDFALPPSAGTGWTLDAAAPYSSTASLQAKHATAIQCAVGYLEGGVTKYIAAGHTFDSDLIAETGTPTVSFSDSGTVRVGVVGDEDADRVYVTVGNGSDPSDPTTGSNDGFVNGRSGFVSTSVFIALGAEAHVKARAWNSSSGLGPASETVVVKRGVGGVAKVLRVPASAFNPQDDLQQYTQNGGYVTNRGVDDLLLTASVDFPEGVTITSMSVVNWTEGGLATTNVTVQLIRVPTDPASALLIAQTIEAGGAALWVTSSDTASENTAGRRYSLAAILNGDGAGGNWPRLAYVDIFYTGEGTL